MIYHNYQISAVIPTYSQYHVNDDGTLGEMTDFEYAGGDGSDSVEYYIYSMVDGEEYELVGGADSVTAAKIIIDRMIAQGVSHQSELA